MQKTSERKITWWNNMTFAINVFVFGLIFMVALGVLYHEFGLGKPIGYWPSVLLSLPITWLFSEPWVRRIAVMEWKDSK